MNGSSTGTPSGLKSATLRVTTVKIERGGKPNLLVEVEAPAGKPVDLFAEDPSDGWSPPLPKRKSFKDGRARFAVALDGTGASPPKNLRLTLVSGDDSVETLAPLD